MPEKLIFGLEWALLLLALAAFTVTEEYRSYVTAGLWLLALSTMLRMVRTRRLFPHTGMGIPWALGMAGAALAVWVAYDRPVALLQSYRFLAACGLFYAAADSPPGFRRWLAGGFFLGAIALAIYWPLHTDFSANPGKLAIITRLGSWINQHLPSLPGPDIHNNVAAGALVVAVPFGMGLAWQLWRQRLKLMAVLAGLGTLVITGGVFMTSSRGAWLALAGVLGLGILAILQRRWLPEPKAAQVFWTVLAGLAVAGAGILFFTGAFDRLAGQIPDPGGGIQSRTHLWAQGLSLIGDYLFTGSGWMSFWMVNSVYALLIHAPFIAHSHNIFLEVWIEQGVLGFLGLALAGAAVGVWAWRAISRKPPLANETGLLWGWVGLASLAAAALHGMVDVVFYVERTLPVVGLLFGYTWFLNSSHSLPQTQAQARRGAIKLSPAFLIAGAALVTALVGAAIALRNPILSAWYANLGAVQQTRLELTRFDPDNSGGFMLDDVRQASAGELLPALQSFNQALALNPANRTALQRRAGLALSWGDYSSALADATVLWQAGYRDDASRLLLGDALVANGQLELAAQAVQDLTWAEPRLRGQAWSRYWEKQDYRRAADAWKTVLLLNPQAQDKTDLDSWIKRAQSKLK